MQKNDMASLRDYLETLPTEQLDAMLDKELHSEVMDDHAVRMILSILREREKDFPVVITPEIETAWRKYQKDTAKLNGSPAQQGKLRVWFLQTVSAAAVILAVLLAIVPQRAQAESIWERLVNWSDSIFEFIHPGAEQAAPEKYVFRTDNPGLQQVYDAVVELGITEPVVPMWLPEGYELTECRTLSAPAKSYVHARFSDSSNQMTFWAYLYNVDVPQIYQKDETQVASFEKNGMTYNIMRNKEMWTVIGSKNSIECSIFINCQEDTLYRILESIYTMEDD